MNGKVTILKIVDVCGSHCVGVEEGTSLFEQVKAGLESGDGVRLDFSRVLTITSSFLSASVGKLYGMFDPSDLNGRLKWTGLDEEDEQLMKLVIRNAKEHFAKSDEARRVDDHIAREAVEGDEHDKL
jgi:hypothetical protein